MPKRKIKLPLILISYGLLLIGYSVLHFYLQHRALTLNRDQVKAYQAKQVQRLAEPSHIYIQWFLDTDIESLSLQNNSWGVSPDKGTFLAQSARPGEPGNIVVYGHNKRSILGNIRALKGGELVTLKTTDGKEHQYIVDSMKEVSPNDVSLLQPTHSEVLTMYTCSGPLDSQRFIVKALPIIPQAE